MFCEAFDISPFDHDAIEKHSWPVASPEAYPLVLRINPGAAMRAPLVWELELIEDCLRAIPPFLEVKSAGVNPSEGTMRLSWLL